MPFVDAFDHARFRDDKLAKNNIWDTPQLVCDVYCLQPGQEQPPHTHAGQSKFYFVMRGEGEFTLGDSVRTCGAGAFVGAADGEVHGVANRSAGDLVLLVGIAPNPNLR